jgi:hypothetical protein
VKQFLYAERSHGGKIADLQARSQESESRMQEDNQNNRHTRESGYPVNSGFPPESIPHLMRDQNDDSNGLSEGGVHVYFAINP